MSRHSIDPPQAATPAPRTRAKTALIAGLATWAAVATGALVVSGGGAGITPAAAVSAPSPTLTGARATITPSASSTTRPSRKPNLRDIGLQVKELRRACTRAGCEVRYRIKVKLNKTAFPKGTVFEVVYKVTGPTVPVTDSFTIIDGKATGLGATDVVVPSSATTLTAIVTDIEELPADE